MALMLPACAMALDEPDVILAQPGDSGYDVRIVLEKCATLGTIKNLPDGEEKYEESYRDGVIELETRLGFTADGIVHLSEFLEIEGMLCEGSKSNTVKQIIEQLRNLEYLTGELPEPHELWLKKYTAGVIKAEKALNLTPDGLLTPSEVETILAQKVDVPGGIKTLKLSASNGKVNVSWSAAKGAIYYKVYRDGLEVAFVYGETSWQDTQVKEGYSYDYYVRPYKYGKPGKSSPKETIEVKPNYRSTNLKEIIENPAKYRDAYVKLGNMQVDSYGWSENDLRVSVHIKNANKTYYAVLILEDYENWTGKKIYNYKLKTINGTGLVTKTGTTPIITMGSMNFTY